MTVSSAFGRPVRTAVFPVGGQGTRFLPATKAVPKELLPIVDKPLLQYAVEEALAAGIERMVFVTARGKAALEDYFDVAGELVASLKAKGQLSSPQDAASRIIGYLMRPDFGSNPVADVRD